MTPIRPNPTVMKSGDDAPADLRRYASELQDTGNTVQCYHWITVVADRIEQMQTQIAELKLENASLRDQSDFESPSLPDLIESA